MSGTDEALSQGRTNPPRASQVVALVDPQPLVFYQPYSGELWLVPAEHKAAFETECRLMDKLMRDLLVAKEEHLKATDALLEAERASSGPGRTIPQHPDVLAQAKKRLKKAEKDLEAAQDAVNDEFKPLDKLDDTGGKLTELIPIVPREKLRRSAKTTPERKGHTWTRQWTYVRNDKVKNKKHHYPLSKGDQAKFQSQSGSFVKNGKLDKKALNDQLTSLDTSVKWRDKWREVQGTLVEDVNRSIEASLNAWADGINGDPTQKVELKPEVQLLRYFAGAGFVTNWDPKKGNVAVRADARAEFALAEGKLTAGAYWPSRGGHPIQMVGPKSGTVYKVGLLRCGFELELSGVAGASACGQLGIEVDYTSLAGGKRGSRAGVRGRPTRKPLSSKGLQLGREVRDGAELSAAGNLFAGARASGSVKGSLQWNDPEKKEFEKLAVVGPGGQVQAGAGISGQLRIDYNNGKFRFLTGASLCWGVGAGGKLEFEVDVKQIAGFIRYLAYALYSMGYEFMEILTEDAFKAWTNFSLWAVQQGKQVADAIEAFGSQSQQAMREFAAQVEEEVGRVALMNRVLANPKALEYAPPEAKGMILYQLTRHGTLTKTVFLPQNQGAVPIAFETLDRRKQAVLTVIHKARSKAEYRNILQHMTATGSKAQWRVAEAHVQRFLDYGIDMKDMDGQMRGHERSLSSIYDRLYEQPVLGHPFVDNNSRQYAINESRGNHAGYLVAGGYDPGPALPSFEAPDGETVETRYA